MPAMPVICRTGFTQNPGPVLPVTAINALVPLMTMPLVMAALSVLSEAALPITTEPASVVPAFGPTITQPSPATISEDALFPITMACWFTPARPARDPITTEYELLTGAVNPELARLPMAMLPIRQSWPAHAPTATALLQLKSSLLPLVPPMLMVFALAELVSVSGAALAPMAMEFAPCCKPLPALFPMAIVLSLPPPALMPSATQPVAPPPNPYDAPRPSSMFSLPTAHVTPVVFQYR